VARQWVADGLWNEIAPLLPAEPPRPKGGRPRVPDRKCLVGIVFVLRTGCAWNHLPAELGCGDGSTCWRRLRQWTEAGVWPVGRPSSCCAAWPFPSPSPRRPPCSLWSPCAWLPFTGGFPRPLSRRRDADGQGARHNPYGGGTVVALRRAGRPVRGGCLGHVGARPVLGDGFPARWDAASGPDGRLTGGVTGPPGVVLVMTAFLFAGRSESSQTYAFS